MIEDDRKIIAENLEKSDEKYHTESAITWLEPILEDEDLRKDFLGYARKNDIMGPVDVADIVTYNNW